MKKALIIAAAVNLLLCSGVQALSASGWVPGVERISEFTDANGDLFYVRNWGDDGVMPADLVDGFELPTGSYVIEEDGTFVPPTILNINGADGSNIPNPTKWRETGKSFEIVSSVEDMTDPTVEYILRNGTESTGIHYEYKEAFGDHGVPVYDALPETVVEGQTISVGGRKYVGAIRPVLGRYYTNAVKTENITLDHRYTGSNELQQLDGYIAISDIEIPEHIIKKAQNGEVVTVRFKGFELRSNCHNGYGFGASTIRYYKDDKLVSHSAATQIYKQLDTNPLSDDNVWTFYLYYRTSGESAENNKYNTSMDDGNTLYLSGGVSPTSKVPFDFDPSQVVVTFDEIIGETWQDQLIWEYSGDYITPRPAGFYGAETRCVVDMEEDMEDVRINYIFSVDSKEYFYADYMDALLRLPDGTVRYYVNGKPQHRGVCVDFDGNYYYVNNSLKAVTDCSYTFEDVKGNGLLPGGTYQFDKNGICTTLPEVIDSSDQDDIRNGLLRIPGGGVRYLENGVPQHKGFVRDRFGNYYYINSSTYAVTDCSYICSSERGNRLIPGGRFNFDEDGHITNLPKVIDGGNPTDIQNGLIRFPDGTIRYMIDGAPAHAGLVQDKDGNTYYINHTYTAVKDVYYPIWKTNGILPAGGYTFDENGVLLPLSFPGYWDKEVVNTIERVQALKEDIGPDAISFVQITDMHVDRIQNTKNVQYIGALAKAIMDSCDVPYAMVTGDNNSRAVHESSVPISIYQDIAWQDEILSPIGWNRIARILGNHDGVWGNDDYYYDRTVTMDEKYNMFYSRSMVAFTYYLNIAVNVGTDETVDNATYFYLDDEKTKTRYINLNSHWAEYQLDNEYHPSYNQFTKGYHYGQAQLTWLANEALDVEDGWTIAVFTHVPPIEQYGPVKENGPSVTQMAKDQYILMEILNAYAGRTSYKGEFTHYGDWRNVSISVDYSENSDSAAKGEIAGVFSGHTHQDSINYETSKYFPVITLRQAQGVGTGDEYEAAFDTVVIDPETKRIHMIRTGIGFNRTAKYTPNGEGVTIIGGTMQNPEAKMD